MSVVDKVRVGKYEAYKTYKGWIVRRYINKQYLYLLAYKNHEAKWGTDYAYAKAFQFSKALEALDNIARG